MGQAGSAGRFSLGVSQGYGKWWLGLQPYKRSVRLHIPITHIASSCSAGAVNQSTSMWALPGGLASPSTTAGFQKGACQEQVFQEARAENARLLVTEIWKSCCITLKSISYSSNTSHRTSPNSRRGELHRHVNPGRRSSLGHLWR